MLGIINQGVMFISHAFFHCEKENDNNQTNISDTLEKACNVFTEYDFNKDNNETLEWDYYDLYNEINIMPKKENGDDNLKQELRETIFNKEDKMNKENAEIFLNIILKNYRTK